MRECEISLTKADIEKIEAESKETAAHLAENYTGDIKDISTPCERKTRRFKILENECRVNEGG